jgi:hypothetical protein
MEIPDGYMLIPGDQARAARRRHPRVRPGYARKLYPGDLDDPAPANRPGEVNGRMMEVVEWIVLWGQRTDLPGHEEDRVKESRV